AGAGCPAPVSQVVAAPALGRVMNSTSPVGRRSRMTWTASAAVDVRIMMPALANVLVFCRLATGATTGTSVTSPGTVRFTKLKPSATPQTSSPAPCTVKIPLANEAEPAAATDPTSCSLQVGGRPPGGAPLVVNFQIGPVVDPFAFRATICQKY